MVFELEWRFDVDFTVNFFGIFHGSQGGFLGDK